MKRCLIFSAILLAASVSFARAQVAPPIVNAAPEQKQIIPKIADGGIPPVVGMQNIQVYRATTSIPDSLDGRGWTYNHHVDMAIWRGHFLLAFTNGQKDEDVWPSREMFMQSEDGLHWTKPDALFPEGVSTSLRIYFYHALNDRLLAIAGLRINTDKLDEATKGGLVVREISADVKLGDVFTLQGPPKGQAMKPSPSFETSADKGLVAACRELLANHTFLEQQDFGALLGANRMAVYEGANKNFGKALNFFHRKDGTLVGISKNGFTITSTDEGKTWTPPVIPPTLLTNNAKVWTQKTSDDRYAMVYNPTGRDRFPLVMTTSDDGIMFDTMRVVHGEVPLQRYPGLNKNVGAQYVRGASIFANDGSRKDDKAMILAYSVNKEDLWVSRIPIPSKSPDALPIADRFDGSAVPGVLVPNWNIYCPQWGSVEVVTKENENKRTVHYMELQDRDPFDYVRADRIFHDSKVVHVILNVSRGDDPRGELDIELSPTHGTARPVRLVLTANKHLIAVTGKTTTDFGEMDSGSQSIGISADCAAGTFSLAFGNQSVDNLPFAEPADSLARLSLRTGPYRGVPEPATIAVQGDKPLPPAVFMISRVEIR